MGDKWDYHLRKVEIAWEIAKTRISWFDTRERAQGDYEKEVKDALKQAWLAVNSSFPDCKE